ncbi:hypothetical protein WM40_22605 [Robbsia andropogonis]|uniref:Uncharacterized protein n=1 Tax=Robbsia andropogonis TaxID=28092 RepID=A0A0F5JV90_9BURK|nr:hypothetical protein WM40_22605 [Robbsia andropogonis]
MKIAQIFLFALWTFIFLFILGLALSLPLSLIAALRETHAKSVCMSNAYARVESAGFFWPKFYCVKRVDQTDVVVPVSSL